MANQKYISYFYRQGKTGQSLAEAIKVFIKNQYNAETEIQAESDMFYLDVTPQKSKKPQLYIQIIDKGDSCAIAMSHTPEGRRNAALSMLTVIALPFSLSGAAIIGGFWGISKLGRKISFETVKKEIHTFIEGYLR